MVNNTLNVSSSLDHIDKEFAVQYGISYVSHQHELKTGLPPFFRRYYGGLSKHSDRIFQAAGLKKTNLCFKDFPKSPLPYIVGVLTIVSVSCFITLGPQHESYLFGIFFIVAFTPTVSFALRRRYWVNLREGLRSTTVTSKRVASQAGTRAYEAFVMQLSLDERLVSIRRARRIKMFLFWGNYAACVAVVTLVLFEIFRH